MRTRRIQKPSALVEPDPPFLSNCFVTADVLELLAALELASALTLADDLELIATTMTALRTPRLAGARTARPT